MPLSSRGFDRGFYIQVIFKLADGATGFCRCRYQPIVFTECQGLLRFITGITER